jgi:zinc protease
VRHTLDNGLRVWSIPDSAAPVVSLAVLVDAGTSRDPSGLPGLASFAASLAAESAGSRNSLELADALARLGARLEVSPGADVTSISVSTLARHAAASLDIVADVVRRPMFTRADFERVCELRLSRLRQASRVAATAADRALIAAVFGSHPYGHGALGTTAAVEAITIDRVREFWSATWQPTGATLIACGDIDPDALLRSADAAFGDWRPAAAREPVPEPHRNLSRTPRASTVARPILAVDRPGAAHAEVRVGQVGPARHTGRYHTLVTLNALLGGQFTSRINRNLRETRAITYGARTAFEFRKAGGLFSGDASVQADSIAVGVTEILREFHDVAGTQPVGAAELAHAQASLTRGYARHFETPAHLGRALAELATYDLPDDTFDRFVPEVLRVTAEDVTAAAADTIHPDECTVVVVADLEAHGRPLEAAGFELVKTPVEF